VGSQGDWGGNWWCSQTTRIHNNRVSQSTRFYTSVQLTYIVRSSLSIADAMLSLIGSVQPDPFSPEHKPQPAISYFTSGRNRRRSQYSLAEEDSVAGALLADDDSEVEEPFTKEEPQSEDEEEGDEDSDDMVGVDHSFNDAFEQMGRETDQLTRELARDAKKSKKKQKDEEAKRKEEKRERKRKRREERKSNALGAAEEDTRPKKKKKRDKDV